MENGPTNLPWMGFFRCNEGKKDPVRLTVSPRGYKAIYAACLKAGTGDDHGWKKWNQSNFFSVSSEAWGSLPLSRSHINDSIRYGRGRILYRISRPVIIKLDKSVKEPHPYEIAPCYQSAYW